jgi:hypothetical protein
MLHLLLQAVFLAEGLPAVAAVAVVEEVGKLNV